MKRGLLISIAALSCAAVPLGLEVAERAPSKEEVRPLTRHLGTALRTMDPGDRSAEYRESIAYLRQHASEATAEVSGFLLESPGSFRKWQVTYLLGELGDESTLALLREFLDRPIPPPVAADPTRHAVDLRYEEEVMSRAQAVMSISRIAWIRPYLRDQVIESLVEVAREVPRATSGAIYELRKLLGDDAYDLRDRLPAEHAWELQRFMPPPEWQGEIAEKMQERDRIEREIEEGRQPRCSLD